MGNTNHKMGDVKKGAKVFKQKCLQCHAVPGPDAKNSTGPILNGLFGRMPGQVEGFSYSRANKESGITWSEDVLFEYIKVTLLAALPITARYLTFLCRAQRWPSLELRR